MVSYAMVLFCFSKARISRVVEERPIRGVSHVLIAVLIITSHISIEFNLKMQGYGRIANWKNRPLVSIFETY